jgi:hypothetical protein
MRTPNVEVLPEIGGTGSWHWHYAVNVTQVAPGPSVALRMLWLNLNFELEHCAAALGSTPCQSDLECNAPAMNNTGNICWHGECKQMCSDFSGSNRDSSCGCGKYV